MHLSGCKSAYLIRPWTLDVKNRDVLIHVSSDEDSNQYIVDVQ